MHSCVTTYSPRASPSCCMWLLHLCIILHIALVGWVNYNLFHVYTNCPKTLKSSHFMLNTENAVLPPKKSINLLPDIFKYHLEAGFSQLCINHFTWNFLHAQLVVNIMLVCYILSLLQVTFPFTNPTVSCCLPFTPFDKFFLQPPQVWVLGESKNQMLLHFSLCALIHTVANEQLYAFAIWK